MDKSTAEALEKSIQHWQENVAAKSYDAASVAGGHCALCHMFNIDGSGDECEGCPVRHHSGHTGCFGTPYQPARTAFMRWFGNPLSYALKEEFHKAAQDELYFLISLRSEPCT